jgi:hypothetical protein
MTAMTYLQKHPKTGVYYFRRAVPPELRQAVGKSEWKRSLKTKDVAEAKRRVHEVGITVERVFQQARSGEATAPAEASLTLEDAEWLATAWLVDELGDDASDRVHGTSDRWIERFEDATGEVAPYMQV